MKRAQPDCMGKSFCRFPAANGAEDDGPPVIRGTLHPSEAETRAIFARWDPLQSPVIVPIRPSANEKN